VKARAHPANSAPVVNASYCILPPLMISYDQPAKLTAMEAKSAAQQLAFAPIAFQAALALVRLGILEQVASAGDEGKDAESIARALGLDEYGVKVLLDMGLSTHLVWQRENRYVLDRVGHFVLDDALTRVNMDFVQDVCYQSMYHLAESVRSGKPAGLAIFGDWPTIYPALPTLPEPARSSWYRFDHYYSSQAFPSALPIVLATAPRHIIDVGGNTGLWASLCARHDPDVRVTILDLPEQIQLTRANIATEGLADRIDVLPFDLLDPAARFPDGADAIWMSQLLDCFSSTQIASILRRAASSMHESSSLFVLETFWDCQRFEAAAYSVNATSLYFTCIANGTSRMYRSTDMKALIDQAGLVVAGQHDDLGAGHTLLHCRPRPS
jgi:hypothetical protein